MEAIAASGHHFESWADADDEVPSTESVYEFTVGKNEIIFSAYFTSGHVVTYTDITEDNHTESCKYCNYTSTVSHSFVYEEIVDEATCRHEGKKELSCACGKTKMVDGKAYLVSKEIQISQRFAESDEGELTYENSWIRN